LGGLKIGLCSFLPCDLGAAANPPRLYDESSLPELHSSENDDLKTIESPPSRVGPIFLFLRTFDSMEVNEEAKAGPSIQTEWSPTTQRKKRTQHFVLAAVLLLVSTYLFLNLANISGNGFSWQWFWQSGNDENLIKPANPDGDQYLLGVGKADITGYGKLYSCFERQLLIRH
jgi:hypothetical protein